MEKENLENRRMFFSKFTRGAVGLAILSVIPSKIFGRSKKGLRDIKISTHNSAVKRTK